MASAAEWKDDDDDEEAAKDGLVNIKYLADGPWMDDLQTHPENRYDFEHAGLKCFIKRAFMRNWNGYVKVPRSHPCFGVSDETLNSDEWWHLDVYGGITYAQFYHQGPDAQEKLYWTIGFDTQHQLSDLPRMNLHGKKDEDKDKGKKHESTTFWTFEKTLAETKELADKLSLMQQ